jgi:hypothetical protein
LLLLIEFHLIQRHQRQLLQNNLLQKQLKSLWKYIHQHHHRRRVYNRLRHRLQQLNIQLDKLHVLQKEPRQNLQSRTIQALRLLSSS